MYFITSLLHVESEAAPHQRIVIDQQDGAGHDNSLYPINSLEKDNTKNGGLIIYHHFTRGNSISNSKLSPMSKQYSRSAAIHQTLLTQVLNLLFVLVALHEFDLFIGQLDPVNALLFQPEISHLSILMSTVLSNKD